VPEIKLALAAQKIRAGDAPKILQTIENWHGLIGWPDYSIENREKREIGT
jgi:hypothetical protein